MDENITAIILFVAFASAMCVLYQLSRVNNKDDYTKELAKNTKQQAEIAKEISSIQVEHIALTKHLVCRIRQLEERVKALEKKPE